MVSCIDHGQIVNDRMTSKNYEVPANSGNNIQSFISKFMKKEEDPLKYKWIDSVNWPNNGPCSRAVASENT